MTLVLTRAILGLAACGLVAVATEGIAQERFSADELRFFFESADTNGDGVLDEAEYAADTAAAFSSLDRKVIRLKLRQLEAADTNQDGVIQLDEMLKEGGHGG